MSDYDFPFGIEDVAELLGLTIRRRLPDQLYTDCPMAGCGGRGVGKMNLKLSTDQFRCNKCGESGGMLKLYAKVRGVSTQTAYREIVNRTALCPAPSLKHSNTKDEVKKRSEPVVQSQPAPPAVIHETYTAFLEQLVILKKHRNNLYKRGLPDKQIAKYRYKSTPNSVARRAVVTTLLQKGCTLEGVPGFYKNEDGRWAIKIGKWSAGFLIPIWDINGLIQGMQIRLDNPIQNSKTKYIWLSSSDKPHGVSSKSPIHFAGDPYAKTVYVTEGPLKGTISHCLLDRTFVCLAGAGNLSGLGELMVQLRQNGCENIVEAYDMDKLQNEHVYAGACRVHRMASDYGLTSKRLTWNPNYKGIDDWSLHLLQRQRKNESEERNMTFKDKYLNGKCSYEDIETELDKWHYKNHGESIFEWLGLTPEEYQAHLDGTLEEQLNQQRKEKHFRIYQIDFSDGPVDFAFCDFSQLKGLGYDKIPEEHYRLVCDASLFCDKRISDSCLLERIYGEYNDDLPNGYQGRSVSVSDVIELYDGIQRVFYYCNRVGFSEQPFFARKTKHIENNLVNQ